MLQAGRSRVRFPKSLDFSINLILPTDPAWDELECRIGLCRVTRVADTGSCEVREKLGGILCQPEYVT
jgi:hypothetical protein